MPDPLVASGHWPQGLQALGQELDHHPLPGSPHRGCKGPAWWRVTDVLLLCLVGVCLEKYMKLYNENI